MKFQLAINLERSNADQDMVSTERHTLEMVQRADEAGFETVWAAEHHALEMTIAPNPFQLLAWWAAHTNNIRLGVAVVNATYWHPIKLAGEAALLDLLSGGRLEFGIGSGAYQREFDRMMPGVSQKEGNKYMREMLPLVQQLWEGDVEHDGEFWQFPKSTSCPKPIQSQVPIWVAARSPETYDHAVANNAHVMCWPLTLPFSEAEKYKAQLDESNTKHGGHFSGRFALMRHAAVYTNDKDRDECIQAIRHTLGRFGNLMMQTGDVSNGFPEEISFEEMAGNARVDPEMLEENLMFGSPETVIEKIKRYEALGVDSFIYYASMGLGQAAQKRSLELFINEVMPEFA
ncbi:MAG: LLM class flavin-dependent oxidoreductase [Pseudomonadales bacterium]